MITKPCYVCGVLVERVNKSPIPPICFPCKREKKRLQVLERKTRDASVTKELGKCAQCRRVLVVPSWKYCDDPSCVFKRQKLQYQKNLEDRIIKRYLRRMAGNVDKTLDKRLLESKIEVI